MPYDNFRHLDREDLYSVVAYIRTLKPIVNDVPKSKLVFPLNLIVRTIPKPASIVDETPADYGKYLTDIASCHFCHTPDNGRGTPLPGMEFAGGHDFGHVQSANITPDQDVGIGKWSKEQFITKFKNFTKPEMQQVYIADPKQNTVMPWTMYAGMKEEDLSAIYDYLRTVKPVHHGVQRFAQPESQ